MKIFFASFADSSGALSGQCYLECCGERDALPEERPPTMTTTTVSKSSVKLIENVVSDVYDVNALHCDALTIEWAACRIAETHGVEKAAKEWKRINARRHCLGLYTSIPAYGTALYVAYFA